MNTFDERGLYFFIPFFSLSFTVLDSRLISFENIPLASSSRRER
jgi:hypothetical protein